DVLGFFIFVSQSLIATVTHLLERNRALAFFGYMFLAHLATYSYLGEKVPWLTTYPFVTGLIYLALYFDGYFRRYPLTADGTVRAARCFAIFGVSLALLGVIFVVEEGDPSNLPWLWFGLAFAIGG